MVFEIFHHLHCFPMDSFQFILHCFYHRAVSKSEYKIQCKTLSAFWSKSIKTIIQVFQAKYSACLSHDTRSKLNNIPLTATAAPVDSGELPPLCLHLVRNMCGFNPTSSGPCLFSVLCCSEFTVCISCKYNKHILCSTF